MFLKVGSVEGCDSLCGTDNELRLNASADRQLCGVATCPGDFRWLLLQLRYLFSISVGLLRSPPCCTYYHNVLVFDWAYLKQRDHGLAKHRGSRFDLQVCQVPC